MNSIFFPPLQQLIPYVEDDSSKLDDRVASQMRSASEERREVLEVNKVSAVSLPCVCTLQSNAMILTQKSQHIYSFSG